MRIIGYLDHPVLKITVFKMDNKYSVKFETGLYEQIYKFREGEASNGMEDVTKIVDAAFCEAVLQAFNAMHAIKNQAQARLFPALPSDAFEEII